MRQTTISKVGAIKQTGTVDRFTTEQQCACSYSAANAKESIQTLNYPHGDFCTGMSQEHLTSLTMLC